MQAHGPMAAEAPLRNRRRHAPRVSPALISAALAAATAALMLSRGVLLTPDGWAYWEGAVSILAGNGYAYFGGQPIRAFPPSFSALLAAVSAVAGVSGATLALVLAGLAAAAAFTWTTVFVPLCGDGPGSGRWKSLIALYMALCVGAWNQALLADALGIGLIGWVSWWVTRCVAADPAAGGTPAAGDLVGLAVSLGALVLTRNAGLAFLPAVALVLMAHARRATPWRRVTILMASVVFPLALAWISGATLGQTRARVVGPGHALYTMSDYTQQIPNGFADLVAHPVLGVGKWMVALAAATAFVWALARLRWGADAHARAAVAVASVGLLGTAALWVLFNLTWVHDELRGRFLWHLPLIVVGTLVVAASRAPATRGRHAATAVAVLVVALQVARVGVGVARTLSGRQVVDVGLTTTIRPDHLERPPLRLGRWTVVSPPSFPWIDRHPDRPPRR